VYSHVPSGLGAVLRDGPFAYLEVFALGMLAAVLTVRGKVIAPNWILAGVALAGFAAVRAGSGNGIVHDLATSVGAFAILMLCLNAGGATVRVLSRPALVRVGIFSYSLYLIHAPVLHLLDLALDNAGVDPNIQFGLLVIFGFPVILLVAYGFHCVFERPFMRGANPVRVTPATVA
jgi:peptidoglycan/LPS O-acetylase OafA/YrhL